MLEGRVVGGSFQTPPLGCGIECGSMARNATSGSLMKRTSLQARRRIVGAVGEPGWRATGWDFNESLRRGLHNGSGASSSKLFAKWKWWERKNESALGKEDALPLPMTYPDSEPLPKEEIDRIAGCDPETESCKSVVYQWTGECRRCQGTGVVSFYRKNGKEVIGNCIMCLGIGALLLLLSLPAEMWSKKTYLEHVAQVL